MAYYYNPDSPYGPNGPTIPQPPKPPQPVPQPAPQPQPAFKMPPSTHARGDVIRIVGEKFGGARALVSDAALRARFLSQLQADPRFKGATIFGQYGDKIRLADGSIIDYIKDASGNPTFAWSVEAGPGGVPVAKPTPVSRVTSASASAKRTNVVLPNQAALDAANKQNQERANQLWQMLMQRAQQGTEIDREDPNIRRQVEPFAAAQERARRQYESEQAERLSARGLGDSGAMDVERRMAMERAGQATGLFESELIGRELASRRAEIAQALGELRGMLTTDQEMALRRELAALDAALRREGLDIERAGLDLQRYGMDQQMNRFIQELAQRSREFDLTQALNWAQFNWMQDPSNPIFWS